MEGAVSATGGAAIWDKYGVRSDDGEDVELGLQLMMVGLVVARLMVTWFVMSGLMMSRLVVSRFMMSGFVVSRLVVTMVAVMLVMLVMFVLVPMPVNEWHSEGLPEYVRDVDHLLAETTTAHPVRLHTTNVDFDGDPFVGGGSRGAGNGVAES